MLKVLASLSDVFARIGKTRPELKVFVGDARRAETDPVQHT